MAISRNENSRSAANLRHAILMYMYENEPVLNCAIKPGEYNSAKDLVHNTDLINTDDQLHLTAGEQVELRYFLLFSTLEQLVHLGFVALKINTLVSIDGGIEGLIHSKGVYGVDELKASFMDVDLGALYLELWEASESGKERPIYLEPTDPGLREVSAVKIQELEYYLTTKGYEVAMALADHEDNKAVRKASVSSAKTARLALWIAGFIAVGSVGNLILNLSDHPAKLLYYVLLASQSTG